MRYILFIVAVLIFTSCRNENGNILKGAWLVEEIHWITKDTTYSINKAQPGIFIISDSVYSFIWTPIKEKRKSFKKLATPTTEEIIYGFQSIVLNAGTYQMTDSVLTINAIVAKVPGFEGGQQTFSYQINDDTLQLKMVDETYPNGAKPAWFGKLETQFVMSRLD
ncbi:hypothetical protein ABN763_07420 [Spongiivirga sp. MCCC 1A20706]|uniref:hypothetical protein n=1 Tax=Spongiivirga sp. MCCC 1A20706 TaxID=3160963 RepID=UPI00397758F0